MWTKIGSSLVLVAFTAYLFHLTLADLDCSQPKNDGQTYPDDDNDTAYFVCRNKQAVSQTCPPNSVYNDTTKNCTVADDCEDSEDDGSGDDGGDSNDDGGDDSNDDGEDDSEDDCDDDVIKIVITVPEDDK